MGELFVWMDKNTDIVSIGMLFVMGLAIVWWVGPILDAWQYAIVRRLRSDADMIAPSEAGLLPVARTVIETGALVQAGLNLVNPAFVRPDARGLLPVNQALIETNVVAQQALALLAQYVANGQPLPPVPQTITYSPHFAYRNDVEALEGAPLPALATLAPKSFLELFQGGALPADKFLMGFDLDSGDQVMATWKQLYSALIGGQSGTGKSTLIRNILVQSALQGGKFVVLDPHYNAGEESLGESLMPLRSLMLCDVASDNRSMTDALHYVLDIGQKRLDGDPDRTPVVLVVDETTGLLQRSKVADELTAALGKISQETRKVGVFALCIGQQFHSDFFDTTVRNSFVSQISTRTRRDVARTQSGNTAFAKEAESLTIGQAVWMQPDGTVTKLAVPNCTEQMIDVVAQTVEKGKKRQPETTQVVEPRHDPRHDPLQEPLPNDDEATGENDVRAKRIGEMFVNGDNKAKIIAEVLGVTAKGGKAYVTASAEYDRLLRQFIKGVSA